MTSKVFDKLYSLILFLLPKLDMAILTGRDDEVCPEKKRIFTFIRNKVWGKRRNKVMSTGLNMSGCSQHCVGGAFMLFYVESGFGPMNLIEVDFFFKKSMI